MRQAGVHMRNRTVSTASLIWFSCAALVAFPSVAKESRDDVKLGSGCAPDRRAILHRAGGVAVANERDEAGPIPCLTATRWRTSEVGLAISNAGSILLQPGVGAPPSGQPLVVLRSTDRGATWNPVALPSGPDVPPFVLPFDGNMGVDRQTGRLFSITPGYHMQAAPEVSRVVFSDDDGRTWAVGGDPVMRLDSGNADSMKIFAGPSTDASRHKVQSYKSVVYNCGGHKPLRCQASHDGGLTWGPAADMPFPPELAPIQGPDNDCSNFGLNGVVARDGIAYVGYAPCNRPYVAVSRDEGETWNAVLVADVETIGYGMLAIGIDKRNTLYAAFVAAADRLPYLSVSHDGAHWSAP